MLPFAGDMQLLIARLDPRTFTAFVERLLVLEGHDVGLEPRNIINSAAIDTPDQGLDVLVRDVPGIDRRPVFLPEGESGFQLKAKKTATPTGLQVAEELRKPGPVRVLLAGGTYILVCSQPLNPAQRTALETAVLAEAAQVLAERGHDGIPSTQVWDAGTLV
jgi:hypothetical protein